MSMLLIATILSVVSQCIVAWLLTVELWLKSKHPFLAGLVQAAGVLLLIYGVGAVMSGVVFGVFLFLFAVHEVSDAALQALQQNGVLFALSILALTPYAFAVLRVIRLVRRGLATRNWQKSGS